MDYVFSAFVNEQYYAVYYTDPPTFYLGRLVNRRCECAALRGYHLQMYFLKRNHITNSYSWPSKKICYECIPLACAFSGPVTLVGPGPFTIPKLKRN